MPLGRTVASYFLKALFRNQDKEELLPDTKVCSANIRRLRRGTSCTTHTYINR